MMPDIYCPRDFDLAGFIVGTVERRRIIDATRILPGDAVIGIKLPGIMEETGAFGAIKPRKPCHRPTASDRDMRGVTPEMLNRHVSVTMGVSAASAAVETRERSVNEGIAWNNRLTSHVSDVHDTLPGTPEREKIVEAALKTVRDKDLGRRFADPALDGLDHDLRRKQRHLGSRRRQMPFDSK
jgi:hypothetical protein